MAFECLAAAVAAAFAHGHASRLGSWVPGCLLWRGQRRTGQTCLTSWQSHLHESQLVKPYCVVEHAFAGPAAAEPAVGIFA